MITLKRVLVLALVVGLSLTTLPQAFAQSTSTSADGRPAQLLQVYRELANNFCDYVRGGWKNVLLPSLVPQYPGVGLRYTGIFTPERTAVLVEDVYKDSSAGRAGVLPGDIINKIGDEAVCTEELCATPTQASLDQVRNRAQELFAHAPDSHIVLIVDRHGKQMQFTLTRGPIAPEVAAVIAREIPLLEGQFAELAPDANELARQLDQYQGGGPQGETLMRHFEYLLEEVAGKIHHIQQHVIDLDQAAKVPAEKQ